jgi:hypothetical protein
MIIASHLLLTAYCSLLTAYCLLLTAYRLLLTAYCFSAITITFFPSGGLISDSQRRATGTT